MIYDVLTNIENSISQFEKNFEKYVVSAYYGKYEAIKEKSTKIILDNFNLESMREALKENEKNYEDIAFVLSSQKLYDDFYGLLAPQEKFCDSEYSELGYANILWSGIKIIIDKSVPENQMVFIDSIDKKYIILQIRSKK
jgi:hypothetical protein